MKKNCKDLITNINQLIFYFITFEGIIGKDSIDTSTIVNRQQDYYTFVAFEPRDLLVTFSSSLTPNLKLDFDCLNHDIK